MTLGNGVLLATSTGVISGVVPIVMNIQTPQIGGDGTATITGDFGRDFESNFRILVSWGDDSFSLDHISALEGSGVQSFSFSHQYNSANLPNPSNPADPIEIRVFIQGAANILEVRANDEVVAPRIDSFAGVDASMSPYLVGSEHFLLSEIFRDLEPSGRVDAFRGDKIQDTTQATQFSSPVFNTNPNEVVVPPATRTPQPIIQDNFFQQLSNLVFDLISDPNSGDGGGNNNFVGNNNGGAGSSTAQVPGTGTSSGDTSVAVFFIVQNDVVAVEFPDVSGIVDTFQFLIAAVEQATSQYVVSAKAEDAAATERIVWLIVIDPNGKVVDEQPLAETVLDDLPKRVFSRLPDGRYEVWLQEAGEKRRRLVIKVTIRAGKPADDTGTESKRMDQPNVDPKKADNDQPGAANQQNPPKAGAGNQPKPNGNADTARVGLNSVPASQRSIARFGDTSVFAAKVVQASREDAFAAWARPATRSGFVGDDSPEIGHGLNDLDSSDLETMVRSDSSSHPAAAAAVVAAGVVLAHLKRDKWERRVDDLMANWQADQDGSTSR